MKHSSGVPLSLGLCVKETLVKHSSGVPLSLGLCVRDSREALFGCSSIFRFVCKGL